MIEYAMHRKEEDGSEPLDVVSCGATKIVTCTDLGRGLRRVVTHTTPTTATRHSPCTRMREAS